MNRSDLRFPGWHLVGAYPEGYPCVVGCWILHHGKEAAVLEVPECLTVSDVVAAVQDLGVTVRFVTASHEHWDHLDETAWDELKTTFPGAKFFHPSQIEGDVQLFLNGEPLWLVKAPKHSLTDVVTVFRGVAMTGDIETGTLDSVTDEVSLRQRRKSMARLREFPARAGYHIHTTVSAHLNSLRRGVDWESLFRV